MDKKVRIRYGKLSVEIGKLYGRRGTVLQFETGAGEMLTACGQEVMLPLEFFPRMISEEAWRKAAEVGPSGATLVEPWELIVREEKRGK